MGFLESLGAGLRIAGGGLSEDVYNQQLKQDEIVQKTRQAQLAAQSEKRDAQITYLKQAVENGSMSLEDAKKAAASIGGSLPLGLGMSESARGARQLAEDRAAGLVEKQRTEQNQQTLGMVPDFLRGEGGIAPVGAQKITSGFQPTQEDIAAGAAAAPMTTEEMKYRQLSAESQLGTPTEAAAARKEMFTPAEKETDSLIKNVREISRLQAIAENPSTTPAGRKIAEQQMARIDANMPSNLADARVAASKAKADEKDAQLSSLADSIDKDFYGAARKFGYTTGAADVAVSDYVMNKKLPSGGRSDLVAKRQELVQAGASRVAARLGKTSDELMVQPQIVKAKAIALDTQMKKEAALSGVFNSFENNLDTWEQAAKGVPPTMAGELDKTTKDLFSKIDFSDVKMVNDAKLAIGKQFNDPAIVAYLTATMTVQADLSRILSSQGQSAARVTDAAMKHGADMIPNGLSDKSRKSLRVVLEADAKGQLAGIHKTVVNLQNDLGVIDNQNPPPAPPSGTPAGGEKKDPLGIR